MGRIFYLFTLNFCFLFYFKGVTFVLANRGMNRKLLDKGLAEWRRRHPKAAENDNND